MLPDPRAQKLRAIELPCDAAYADAEVHPHEKHRIRKLSDPLFVDHRDVVIAKPGAHDRAAGSAEQLTVQKSEGLVLRQALDL
jgi:hypothetical protein